MYQLWSGIIPSLVVLGAFGAIIRWARGHTCPVNGCWRGARYDAGTYRVCLKHHPVRDPAERIVTPEMISRAYYHDVQGRLKAGREVGP
jgi:hypothetical protein